jgi:uncharacterized protein YjbI with pentapeptide repeats
MTNDLSRTTKTEHGVTPTQFELAVAQVYRDLGAQVVHNKNVGGLQVDVFAVQRTPDGSTIRTAIECKAYVGNVGVSTVVDICKRIGNLRTHGLIEKGIVVAAEGFTQDARTHCELNLVECFTLDQLHRKVADFSIYLNDLIRGDHAPPGYEQLIKKGAIISLGAHGESGEPISSLVDHIESWLIAPGAFVTVLGEYGSGKTTTSWHIAQKLASDHIRGVSERIPILIELKGFNNNFNLRTFLADLMVHQKGIKLRSYSLFEKLNREGKFIIIFDGFDEMTTYPDPALVFRNLDEILSLTHNKAKVILTCRSSFFRDRADIERLKAGTDLQSLLHRKKGYQVLFVDGFTEEQVQQYLSCHYGKEWVDYYNELSQRPRLRTLAERPILLHMIVETVSNVKSFSAINEVRLYEEYTNIWLKRDDWRCNLTPDQRQDISEVLAFELLKNQGSIHHKDLKIRIASYFEGSISERILDQYAHEVRTCTFLKNDMQGLYRFVNLSFAEFLAAKYLLRNLIKGETSFLAEALTHETLHFLSGLIKNEKHLYLKYIWDLMRTASETGDREHLNQRIRAVSAFVLLNCRENLSNANLSEITLPDGADFGHAQLSKTKGIRLKGREIRFDGVDLTGADFTASELRNCSFRKAALNDAIFIKSDLSGSDFGSADMRGTNFSEAVLKDIVLTPSDFANYLKKRSMARLVEEQVRFGAIKQLGEYVQRIQQGIREMDRKERRAAKGKRGQGLLRLQGLVLKGDPEEPDVYISHISSFKEQLTKGMIVLKNQFERSLREIENEHQIKLKKHVASISQLHYGERPRKMTHPTDVEKTNLEAQLSIKRDQKIRNLRGKYKTDRQTFDHVLKQLKAIVDEVHRFSSIENNRKSGRISTAKVQGAIFSLSSGLTQHQLDWLSENRAVLKVDNK